MKAWEQVADRVGQCTECGGRMKVKHPNCMTCSPKCRKRRQRRLNLELSKGNNMIRINGVEYPAHVLNMFSDDEIFEQTGGHYVR